MVEINVNINMQKEFYDCMNRLTAAILTVGFSQAVKQESTKNTIKEETPAPVENEIKNNEIVIDNDNAPREDNKKTAEIKYTKDDVISALQNLARKKGKAESKALLEKYNATKVSSLDESDYSEFIKDIERMI